MKRITFFLFAVLMMVSCSNENEIEQYVPHHCYEFFSVGSDSVDFVTDNGYHCTKKETYAATLKIHKPYDEGVYAIKMVIDMDTVATFPYEDGAKIEYPLDGLRLGKHHLLFVGKRTDSKQSEFPIYHDASWSHGDFLLFENEVPHYDVYMRLNILDTEVKVGDETILIPGTSAMPDADNVITLKPETVKVMVDGVETEYPLPSTMVTLKFDLWMDSETVNFDGDAKFYSVGWFGIDKDFYKKHNDRKMLSSTYEIEYSNLMQVLKEGGSFYFDYELTGKKDGIDISGSYITEYKLRLTE